MQHACKSELSAAEKVVNISLGPSRFRATTAKTSSDTTDSGLACLCVLVFIQKLKTAE